MSAGSSHNREEAARASGQLDRTKPTDQHANIWGFLFKDCSWLHAVASLKYNYGSLSPPLPTVLGYDLGLYYSSLQPPSCLALLISDWGGDARYERETLFASFRDQDYYFDKESSEVRFNKSGMILHVGEPLEGDEWIRMKDPSRLFQHHQGELQTAAVYYNDDSLHTLGPDQIGGIEDFTGKEHVRYICSIQLKFGDGRPVNRVIVEYNIPFKLVNEQAQGKARAGIVGWRLARAEFSDSQDPVI